MKTSTRRMFRWVLGASLVLSAFGCGEGLTVKKQTVFVKLDQRNESIAILAAHEGFSVTPCAFEKKETAVADAKKKLAAFSTSERTVWLFIDYFLDPLEIDPKRGELKDVLWIKRKLAKFIDVKPGAFLLNNRGELSGYQTIAIPRAKDFAKVLNEMISKNVKAIGSSPVDSPDLSQESVRLIEDAATKNYDWLRFENGHIVLGVPLTRDDAETLLAKKETDKEMRESLERFRKVVGDFRIARSRDGLEIVFGDEKTRVLTLTIPEEKHSPAFERELLEFARELPGAFDKSQDMQTFIGKFIATP